MNYFSKGNPVDSVHRPWTTSGSRSPPWIGGSTDRRAMGHSGVLVGVSPPATPARAQQREGSAGNPSRATLGLRRRCGDWATTEKRRRWNSMEVALEHGEGRRGVGRGAVGDGGVSPFYRGREAVRRGDAWSGTRKEKGVALAGWAAWAAQAGWLTGLKARGNSFRNKIEILEFAMALEICTKIFRRNFEVGIFPKFS
jgi:hypothetical protein